MKKQTQSRSVRIKLTQKRTKRALRSQDKRRHRLGTGFKELEEKAES